MWSRQASTGSGSSSLDCRRNRIPEPLDIGLAEDGLRPALVRVRHDRPVEQALIQDLHVTLGELAHPRLADARAVEVGEELGLRVADDLDQRTALTGDIGHLLQHPRRGPVERVLVGELDPRAPDMLVRVVDVHVARAALVRAPRDRARERRVLGQGRKPQNLALADVRAHLDRKACVALEPFVG